MAKQKKCSKCGFPELLVFDKRTGEWFGLYETCPCCPRDRPPGSDQK